MNPLNHSKVADVRRKLKRFTAEGLDVQLFAVSAADAAAEAFANQDNQVYFGKGQITLREGAQGSPLWLTTPHSVQKYGLCQACMALAFSPYAKP